MTLFVFFCALTRPSVWCLMVNGFSSSSSFLFFSLLLCVCVLSVRFNNKINKIKFVIMGLTAGRHHVRVCVCVCFVFTCLC